MSVPEVVQVVATLYDDPQRCATLAKLRYVNPEDPGLRRIRAGRGFTYRDAQGLRVVDAKVRERIAGMAIPPAWRNVWICTREDGHILAVGEDDRGRRQYIYHERWRALRDQLNFDRIIGFGAALPTVRVDVERQLRRRTLDTDRVLATMLRVIDRTGLRVGNEVYAEENDSYGLSTLTKKHVVVRGSTVNFCFPAKSGQQAQVTLRDPGAARVIALLLQQRGRRLFTVAGAPIDSDDINKRLADLTGAHFTAKDFRTWHGTVVAFAHLRAHLDATDRESEVVRAIDAASDALGNTRAIARGHYVHPDVVQGYVSGELDKYLRGKSVRPGGGLEEDEALLLAYLSETVEERAASLSR